MSELDNNEKIICTPAQKQAQVCPEYYSATCGWFKSNILCYSPPCSQVYANSCFACLDPKIDSYTPGNCPN